MSRLEGAERGESLIEILVALAILGIGITALLGALATNATVTGINRAHGQVSATVLAASEYVKSLAPVTCGGTAQPITDAQVPHDETLFTITYGPAVDFSGSTPCATLARVPVRVVGDGFDVSVDVVKRP